MKRCVTATLLSSTLVSLTLFVSTATASTRHEIIGATHALNPTVGTLLIQEEVDTCMTMYPLNAADSMASGSGEAIFDLQATGDLAQLYTERGYAYSLEYVAFSPTGQYLVTVGSDDGESNTIKLWYADIGALQRSLSGSWPMFGGEAGDYAFSPDERQFAAVRREHGESQIFLFDVAGGANIAQWSVEGEGGDLHWMPDRAHVALIVRNSAATPSSETITLLDTRTGAITGANIPTGEIVAGPSPSDAEGQFRIYRAAGITPYYVGYGRWHDLLAVSPDGQLALTVASDNPGVIHAWDIESGEHLHCYGVSLPDARGQLGSNIVFDSTGSKFAGVFGNSEGNWLVTWSLSTFAPEAAILLEESVSTLGSIIADDLIQVTGLTWTDSGEATIRDTALNVWNGETGELVGALRALGPVHAVDSSFTGRSVVARFQSSFDAMDFGFSVWDATHGSLAIGAGVDRLLRRALTELSTGELVRGEQSLRRAKSLNPFPAYDIDTDIASTRAAGLRRLLQSRCSGLAVSEILVDKGGLPYTLPDTAVEYSAAEFILACRGQVENEFSALMSAGNFAAAARLYDVVSGNSGVDGHLLRGLIDAAVVEFAQAHEFNELEAYVARATDSFPDQAGTMASALLTIGASRLVGFVEQAQLTLAAAEYRRLASTYDQTQLDSKILTQVDQAIAARVDDLAELTEFFDRALAIWPQFESDFTYQLVQRLSSPTLSTASIDQSSRIIDISHRYGLPATVTEGYLAAVCEIGISAGLVRNVEEICASHGGDYLRGLAHMLFGDLAAAATDFRLAIAQDRVLTSDAAFTAMVETWIAALDRGVVPIDARLLTTMGYDQGSLFLPKEEPPAGRTPTPIPQTSDPALAPPKHSRF